MLGAVLNIYGKELGSILWPPPTPHPPLDKKYPHDSGFIQRYSKISTLESGFKICGFVCSIHRIRRTEAVSGKKMLRIQKYPDTCGRGISLLIFKTKFDGNCFEHWTCRNSRGSILVLLKIKFCKVSHFVPKQICFMKFREDIWKSRTFLLAKEV